MRSLLSPVVLCVVLGSSLNLYADLIPASLLPNNLNVVQSNGPEEGFLGTPDVGAEGVVAWTPQASVSGVASCNAAENANCLSTLDFMKLPDGPSLLGFVDPGGPVRNNLPEPSSYLLIVGAVPLVWRRLRRLVP